MNNETQKPLDFAKIDALRKYMLLTVDSMCTLLKVSRVSYYNWIKGGKVRKGKADYIRKLARNMASLIGTSQWPNPDVYVADQATRLSMLQDVLEKLDKEPVQQ